MSVMSPATAQSDFLLSLSVREEDLFPTNPVSRNRRLTLHARQPVGEAFRQLDLDARMHFWIHDHHGILVEKPLVTAYEYRQVAAILEIEPSTSVGKQICIHRRSGVKSRAHAGASISVPRTACAGGIYP